MIDMHIHTTYSDGAYSPEEIVQMAYEKGLRTISITDHDTIDGLEKAIVCGKDLGVEVIPGLEISTDIDNVEVHLLAYFIDYKNEELKKYLAFFKEERYHRAKRIVDKLRNLGMNIKIDDVIDRAQNSAIGRPHIAYTLVDLGIIDNYFEAFEKYIGDKGPAYERKIHFSPQSALKLIEDAGGLSFIAHPGFIKESILVNIIEAGLDGIEVIHPSHNDNQIGFYKGIVNQYCLLESGGSDFHGGKKNDEDNLGKFNLAPNHLDAMRKMLHRNTA
ncbi:MULTISPECIES: PHP domain-containing protein [Melioribacter]|nr:PHP domain-containing protein [Melioribacter roseus]